MKQQIYMDNQATTPLDERVMNAMMPYLTVDFGNPHSRSHMWGKRASDALENSRATIAKSIGAEPEDIIFTSGATEANNMAIKGVYNFYKKTGKNHIITTKIEHKCVLNSCKYLEEQEGAELTILSVNEKGILDLDELKKAIKPNTLLVSVMFANNEIGTVQPVKEIAKICNEKGIFFHCDAAQALGRIPIDMNDFGADLMSLSAHKVYGPKGIGALYVRRKPRRVKLTPLIHGGGQERGLRSGTMPTPLCVGFAKAVELAVNELPVEMKRQQDLRDYMWSEISKRIERVYLNGEIDHRLPNNLNISFEGIEGESLLIALSDEVGVSSGSACNSATLEPSYVLMSMGVDTVLAQTSIRIGFSRFTTKDDVEYTIAKIEKAVARLRDMSPLWEMIQDGIDISKIQWIDH